MSYLSDNFPNYDCNDKGEVFKNQMPAKVFKSNKYKQVLLIDKQGRRKVCGVHTVIAMKYLEYFEGCVVHHKDENTDNNRLDNLEIMTRTDHARIHACANDKFKFSNKGKPSKFKGQRRDEEFCRHCSIGAKLRRLKEKLQKEKERKSHLV